MKAIVALVALCAIANGSVAQTPGTPAPKIQKKAGFDPKRDAAKDIANAAKVASKQNKRILLDVGGEW